ncbi:MAG: M48 family metallopeptidase [Candidatus Omnitrophota bacterium]|nr:M48 family metallopeptidase [Candidatus Omnitrophota bacterium]
MEVEIVRSHKRRRTVSARLIKDTLLVNAPFMLPQKRLDRIIDGFKIRFEKNKLKVELKKKESLVDIAARLNERYFSNQLRINSIEYVTTQNHKFGCCNFHDGRIRISHKVGFMPRWVRDYVIIHEMAHLIEPNHSRKFWMIVCRYKLAERARGFLLAAGILQPSAPGLELPK